MLHLIDTLVLCLCGVILSLLASPSDCISTRFIIYRVCVMNQDQTNVWGNPFVAAVMVGAHPFWSC